MGDRGHQEQKRVNQRRETDAVCNQFLKCSPQSGPLRDVQSFTEKRRGRKETEVARRIKGDIKRRQIQSVISSLSVFHRLEHTKRFTELGREKGGKR